ncbi:MAG: hypothetical protein MMC33_005298 [Icmadophila ericetorum]|nr:hypothetical protein [Icmadophila ericetorum]
MKSGKKSDPAMSSMATDTMASHATATIGGKVIADAESWETVEGNIYFPPSSLDKAVLTASNTTSVCPWKGTASYYNIVIDGKETKDAAWYYPEPKAAASNIKDHVAFYKNKVNIKS